jgi:uncharacterized membrane protein YjfL (UPF0719 family)
MSRTVFLFAGDAATPAPTVIWHADSFGMALAATAAFGLIGVVILVFGFKLFEWITVRVDIEKQLEEKNLAVAIVVGSLLLGLSWIVVRSMG